MRPYAELLYYSQLNPNTRGATRIRDNFKLREPEDIIEFGGRNDYGPTSTAKLGEKSLNKIRERVPIIQKWLDMGHTSMIEMGDATFYLECSRVVSHELVRHRLASFQQESQRFVNYGDEYTDDLFYEPYGFNVSGEEAAKAATFVNAYQAAMESYRELLANGVPKQVARYVLPNAMRTRIIMKANVREWRHIIRLRLDKSAQPEMQELMQQVYEQLVEIYPNALHGVLNEGRGDR